MIVPKQYIQNFWIFVVLWCSGYHYYTTSFKQAWTQVLHRFKSCLWRVRDLRWWGSLKMVPAGNKVKCLSLFNYTTKTIHHHSLSSSFLKDMWPHNYNMRLNSLTPIKEPSQKKKNWDFVIFRDFNQALTE